MAVEEWNYIIKLRYGFDPLNLTFLVLILLLNFVPERAARLSFSNLLSNGELCIRTVLSTRIFTTTTLQKILRPSLKIHNNHLSQQRRVEEVSSL